MLINVYPVIMLPIISCLLYSCLKPLFYKADYESSFLLNIYGNSGVGKSTLVKWLFVQCQNQYLNYKTESKSSLIKIIHKLVGRTVMIDDYHREVVPYGKLSQQSKQDLLARISDDSQSAFIVTTSEMLEGAYSVQDRMLQLHLKERLPQIEELRKALNDRATINTFITHFYRCVIASEDEVLEYIKEKMKVSDCTQFGYRIETIVTMLSVSIDVFCDFYLNAEEKSNFA